MSKKALQETLQKILDEIRENSNTYRKLVSNREAHEINIDANEIKKEVKKELSALFNIPQKNIPQSIISVINTEVPQMCRNLYKQFTPEIFYMTSKEDVFNLGSMIKGSTPLKFSVVLAPASEKSPDVFRKIQTIKRNAQELLVQSLNAEISLLNKGRSKNNKLSEVNPNKFLDIGHEEAVSKERKKVAERMLYAFGKSNKSTAESKRFLNSIAKELSLSINKKPGVKKSSISVYFESTKFNQLKGATTEKQFASITGSLTKDLEQVLSRLEGQEWVEQKGSSSQLEIIEAEILNPLSEVEGKRIRNKIKQRKIDLRSNTATITRKMGKIQKGGPSNPEGSKLFPIEQQSPSSFPLELLVTLNKRLPMTVMKNMEYPALENRTGRFANSVKAISIISTPKGFPSVEYTYQLDPYQTFEQGRAMGSADRDPRKLIDRSIREIASEYAMMRFYTRRV